MAQVKVAIIGDGGVGKTAFVRKLNATKFSPRYIATIGCDKRSVPQFNVCAMDFGGQEKFGGAMTELDEADAVIVMFDLKSLITFNNLPSWTRLVRPGVPIVVVGNKIDVSARNFLSSTFDPYPYVEISAKTGQDVDSVLFALNLTKTATRLETLAAAVCSRTMVRSELANIFPEIILNLIKE